MEGTIPVVPCKIFWTMYTISSGKTSRLNCPGRQALVSQILSPVLTGKLIVERNGEQETLTRWLIQFFFYLNFLFSLAAAFTVGNQHTKIRQRCHYAEQAELSMQFKLIPINLTDRLVRNFRHVVSCSRATKVPRPSRVLQFFFLRKFGNHFFKKYLSHAR